MPSSAIAPPPHGLLPHNASSLIHTTGGATLKGFQYGYLSIAIIGSQSSAAIDDIATFSQGYTRRICGTA